MINKSRMTGWLAGGLLVAVLTLGCSLYRDDRCYVSNEQYSQARTMFIKSGSLDLVERELKDMQWRRSKINEILYRLRKEFEVLPEEIPGQTQ
jgi:hypothetical protein